MKKILYKIVNKLGYSIENKSTRKFAQEKSLEKFNQLKNFNLIIQAKNYVLNLDREYKNFTINNSNDGFQVSFMDLKIYVETLEEFNILNEVFVKKDYNFLSNKKSILIDIGANIGISSLFFSKQDYIKEIYAYEPIEVTYKQAQYNFLLNKGLNKVKTFKNVGLGDSNREELFLFNKKNKGNTGIRGKLSPSNAENNNLDKVKVQICDASEELNSIIEKLNGEKVIVKMDCEGAEYEIIENLQNSGVLTKIDTILLEWHDKGSNNLEKHLLDSGFQCLSLNLGPISGMIYANKFVD